MSSSRDAPDHPLAHNWNKPAPSASRSDSFKQPPNPVNPKQQGFAKKRRESILAIAPDIHPTNQRKLAIKCENVCLTYGEGESTNYVLNGLTLSVPKGKHTNRVVLPLGQVIRESLPEFSRVEKAF